MLWLNSQPTSPPPANDELVEILPPVIEDGGTFGLYTLAVSWQPGFCETEPRKPECGSLGAGRFDADHFTLHGLWPQDSYCSVSQRLIDTDKAGSWSDLPELDLSTGTRSKLETIMPGTRSFLERHEWLVHGTCSGVSPEAYYQRALAFMDALNASPLRDLFASNIGQGLSSSEIRTAFEKGFGRNAGSRLRVYCDLDDDREIVTELRIRLYGEVMSAAPLAQLIGRATPGSAGCESGIIDPVGDQ